MKKNNIIIALLIIFDVLLLIINFHLVGGLGAFTIDNTINTLSFISLVVTVIIAFLVPFLIKKAIDDNRGIKALLIEEINELICTAELNHKIISDLFANSTEIDSSHRDGVLENFFDIELKIDSLSAQFDISYPSKSKILEQVVNHCLEYKRFLTDGKFLLSKFTHIDADFYREEKNAFAKLRKELVTKIHEIHKF